MSTSNKKKLKPEKLVSFEKTKVDLDKIPPWVLFTSYLKRLFGLSADIYEYHEVYDIYGRRERKTSLTETFFVGFIMIVFIIICLFTIYVVIKSYSGKDENKQLVKDFTKVHIKLNSPANALFTDRIVKDLGTQNNPDIDDYKTLFDYNAFALWQPGGGKIPHETKNCFSFDGGAQAAPNPPAANPPAANPGGQKKLPKISFDTDVGRPNIFKVIESTGLQPNDIKSKIENYFSSLKFKGETYFIFKTNSGGTMNTVFSAVK